MIILEKTFDFQVTKVAATVTMTLKPFIRRNFQISPFVFSTMVPLVSCQEPTVVRTLLLLCKYLITLLKVRQ